MIAVLLNARGSGWWCLVLSSRIFWVGKMCEKTKRQNMRMSKLRLRMHRQTELAKLFECRWKIEQKRRVWTHQSPSQYETSLGRWIAAAWSWKMCCGRCLGKYEHMGGDASDKMSTPGQKKKKKKKTPKKTPRSEKGTICQWGYTINHTTNRVRISVSGHESVGVHLAARGQHVGECGPLEHRGHQVWLWAFKVVQRKTKSLQIGQRGEVRHDATHYIREDGTKNKLQHYWKFLSWNGQRKAYKKVRPVAVLIVVGIVPHNLFTCNALRCNDMDATR